MFKHRKISRLWKIIFYLSNRISRVTINQFQKDIIKEKKLLISGYTETIKALQSQNKQHLQTINIAHDKSLNELHNDTEKKLNFITSESNTVQLEMNETIDLFSKSISKLSEIEELYEKTFNKVNTDLKLILPQLRASLGVSIKLINNLEVLISNTSEKISNKKKDMAELVQKQHLKGKEQSIFKK